MQHMRNQCFCPHCTATVEESAWYFGLFCELDIVDSAEDRPIAAAPTLHPGDLHRNEDVRDLAAVAAATAPGAEQPELDLEYSWPGDGSTDT